MHNLVDNLISIKKEIQAINPKSQLIVVTKTFGIQRIEPLIKFGHRHFGENKVQETVEKWSDIKNKVKDIQLHLIGKLQTNKVKYCLPLFDYIHGLDNIKLAEKIASEQIKKNFKPKIFIQINIGDEDQKSGINQKDVSEFYTKLKNDFDLNIIGLMCIPPFVKDTKPFFSKMKSIADNLNLNELSMGMSSDYIEAVKNSATYVRIGSKIMGDRKLV